MQKDIRQVLNEGYSEAIRDVLWGHIYLTPEMQALTKSKAFMRLTRIMQLGPALYTYPGATHTRAAHSVGVYHLSRRLIQDLCAKGADAWVSAPGICSFLCAALLHDLGHFPYTHSLKELPLKSHEELTGELILAEPVKSLVARTGADPYFTAAIVDTKLPCSGETELLFYRKLLSGVLDPDKLDYLNRDARYCGVPYGAQDVDFTYSRLYPHKERGVDIDTRGITSIESILFAKYLMYRSVYWHRSVRAATAMVKKALQGGLAGGVLKKEELYGLDDQGLFEVFSGRSHPLFYLAEAVRDGQLYGTAMEVPYDEKKYPKLAGGTDFSSQEQDLADAVSKITGKKPKPGEILIDLPESISFETGLYVNDGNCTFSESSSAFTTETVEAFVKSLRIIRIFIHPRYDFSDMPVSLAEEILQR
ncbi:HD domain-containing protein [Breznakiella homolactica]|uniref:HD domain-containing protein n=1 Tax=Breznakiella homolactica TaxID=2798577 RepID=A0A7T7XRL2_9SPIR|nr:HD domain-containing protein [Breznakiella homolactica]QQO11113.1 HD domain-containing protein [Breznakiella homolactica]